MQKVRKAVIPAAGFGTRFLPATKAMPKEMLPVVDIPTIQYIVEEIRASGIEQILIISGHAKPLRTILIHLPNWKIISIKQENWNNCGKSVISQALISIISVKSTCAAWEMPFTVPRTLLTVNLLPSF